MQLLYHHPHYKVGIEVEGKTYIGEENRNIVLKLYDAGPSLRHVLNDKRHVLKLP